MLAVVIPAYNRADRLEKALHSLEGQIYKRFFTIVVDDCSDEDLKSVCDKSKLKITYIRQEKNQGPAAARQRGLDLCIKNNIDLIMFMDSDDLYMPHTIQTLIYEINHSNNDMIASGITGENEYKPNSTLQSPDNITGVGGKIYRVNSLVRYDINFNTELRTNEDLDFNLKVKYSDMKKGSINDVLYLNCNDKRSITRNGDYMSQLCNGLDYINAIHAVFKGMLLHKIDIEPIMFNIIKCYTYYEGGKERFGEIPKNIDDKLIEILSSQEFEKKLDLMYYGNRMKVEGCGVEDKKVYLFKETIYDGFKNHGYERSN